MFIDKKPVPKRYVAHDTLAAPGHSPTDRGGAPIVQTLVL